MHPQQSAEFLSNIKQDDYQSPTIEKFASEHRQPIQTLLELGVRLKPVSPRPEGWTTKSPYDADADPMRRRFNCDPVKNAKSTYGTLREWQPGWGLVAITGERISVLETYSDEGRSLLNSMTATLPKLRGTFAIGDREFKIFDNQNIGRIELPGFRFYDNDDFVFIPGASIDGIQWCENSEPRFDNTLGYKPDFAHELISMHYTWALKQRRSQDKFRKIETKAPLGRVSDNTSSFLKGFDWNAISRDKRFNQALDGLAFHFGFHLPDSLHSRDMAFDWLKSNAESNAIEEKSGMLSVAERIRINFDLGAKWKLHQTRIAQKHLHIPKPTKPVKKKSVMKVSAGK